MARVKRTQMVTIEVTYEIDDDNDLNEPYKNAGNWKFWAEAVSRYAWNDKFTKQPVMTIEHVGPLIERPVMEDE